MQENAKVIALKGKYARVKMTYSEACDTCKVCDRSKPFELNVYNEVNAKVDDDVVISVDKLPKMFAPIMYIAPLLSMIIGYYIGLTIFHRENMAVLTSFIFLLVHAAVVAIVSRKKKYRAGVMSRAGLRGNVVVFGRSWEI